MENAKKCDTTSKDEIYQISQFETKNNNNRKSKKLIFILALISITILCGILIFIFVKIKILREKEKIIEIVNSDEKEEIKEDFQKYDNVIKAIYYVKKGQKMSFFNREQNYNLTKEDYIIIETSFNKSYLRKLKNLELKNDFYVPSETGYLSIEIIFKKSINNLDNFFSYNKELIKVNMSNFKMDEITSMKSTFSGCSNLEEVTFEGTNSKNLRNLDNTFENCTNIKNVNLALNDTSNIEETNNTFFACENLESINLTTFKTIKIDMFRGIRSTPNISTNELISNDIKNIFYEIFNMKINITIKTIIPINECEKGDGEKCKSCSHIHRNNCLSCNDGYYLPFNKSNREKCVSCNNIIEGCSSCDDRINYIECIKCKLDYYLENNTCIEKPKIIPYCLIGDKELCSQCNINETLRNECGSCNQGYYLPSNAVNKTFCENCNKIKECIECSGTKENPLCSKCAEGYKLENNSCEEDICIIGEKEKCKTCRNENGRKKECGTCNEGYYLLNKENYECKKCSIYECKKCSLEMNEEKCEECNNHMILKNNECTYPTGYIPENPITIIQYKHFGWIEAEYDISDNKSVFDFFLLDQGNPPYIGLNDIEMFINGTKIPIFLYNYRFYYNFSKLGIYKIKIFFKKTLYSMRSMFMNIHTLKTIKFVGLFDALKVEDMSCMFCGCYAESIDISNLYTENLLYLENFLWGADYLKTFKTSDLFNTSKVIRMNNMFYANRQLNEIDLSDFDTSNVKNCKYMFDEFPIYTIIIISNKFTKCREFIPFENKVINIDDIACKNISHCKECIGSKETLSCSICEMGYELKNNKCIKSKCNVGYENKCKKCQTTINHENECLICNEGYYLPQNSLDKTECNKCIIDGCKICNSNSENCDECKRYYKPIYAQNSEIILSCELTCELGEQNKCATCNEEEGKENLCSSCNQGYRLMTNGTCKKIENSFVATYNIVSISKPIRIMRKMIGHIHSLPLELSNIEAFINDKKVEVVLCDYSHFCLNFDKIGLIQVKLIINRTLQSMNELFYYYDHLIEIKFSDTFDTSKVLSMDSMFYECRSLRKVVLSSFNTTINCAIIFMFGNCYELTSIDLSNFDTKNVQSFQDVFQNNKKLTYVDISSFDTRDAYLLNLFSGVGNNGTLVINKKTYTRDIPNGWNIIYKE